MTLIGGFAAGLALDLGFCAVPELVAEEGLPSLRERLARCASMF